MTFCQVSRIFLPQFTRGMHIHSNILLAFPVFTRYRIYRHVSGNKRMSSLRGEIRMVKSASQMSDSIHHSLSNRVADLVPYQKAWLLKQAYT